MMKLASFYAVFVSVIMISTSCEGYKFHVGGRDGWVTHPSEDYNHWAQRMRFQVNDTLLFKYNKGNESVLVVTKENYNTCNTNNPIKTLSEGDVSEYKFERSGPHYFISGNSLNCKNGQKLIIVVLAIRHKKSPSPKPATTPSPAPTPAVPSSEAPSPAPETADSPTPTPAKSAAPMNGYSVGVVLGFVGVVSVMVLGV